MPGKIERWRVESWLEDRPKLITGAIIAFLVLSVLFSIVSQRGFELRGDGAYYLAMQQAWLVQAWPAIDPSLREALMQHPDIGPEIIWYMLIEGADGRSYSIHFWFYSLLSAPFALVLGWFGLDPILGFLAINLISVSAAGYVLARSPSLSPLAKLFVAVSFGATALNWYAAWTHPEVFTASLLLIAGVAFLDRRILLSSLCIGMAALQNPSAVLMLGALGLAALADAWDAERRRLKFSVLFDQGWRLAFGAAVASIAPLFNLIWVGVVNPILSSGFVTFSQLNATMLGHLLLDPDQGAIIAFPFVFAGIVVVLMLRALRARDGKPGALFDRSDALLLGVLLMLIPVLTQNNFNAGQYYVIRYVSWAFAPALVWLGRQFVFTPAPVAGVWTAGLAVYAVAFVSFLAAKFAYAAESRRDPTLPSYVHSFQFKPWTRVLLDHAPALHNPWPGVFAERTLRDREVLEPLPDGMPVIYRRGDGVITKVLTTPEARFTCEGGRFAPIAPDGAIRITDAGAGLIYLNGEMQCTPSA